MDNLISSTRFLYALLAVLLFISTSPINAQDAQKVDVNIQNAHKTLTYLGALIVDGKEMTLSNQELIATQGNEIAVLVINGGHLTLNNCTIRKTGDAISQSSGATQPSNTSSSRTHRPRPEGNASHRQRPREEQGMDGHRPKGEQEKGQRGQRPNGGGGDDSFSFYGLNSAVVVLGKDSRIDMNNCQVETNANQANAIFACDEGTINITNGIRIRSEKGGSRGLFATCAGIINADGVVDIQTKGAHCAALATDRGGGTVTVGHAGTKHRSHLFTGGEGSPCVYSTGDITVYNAEGDAATSQALVVEGRNTINLTDCNLSGKSPQHGGIMLYQSTSGDAKEGTSTLTMKRCSIQDNNSTMMFLITNTHSIVNLEDCTFLNAQGKKYAETDALVVCRNCNNDGRGHHWGSEGRNGGQVDINLTNQTLIGTLLANETESVINIQSDKKSNIKKLNSITSKGVITLK